MIIAGLLRLCRHREEAPASGRHDAEEMDARTRRTVRAQYGKHSWTTKPALHAAIGVVA
jgi:hypothetical protein